MHTKLIHKGQDRKQNKRTIVTWVNLHTRKKDAHGQEHVKILFNKRGGLRKQMIVTVSILVFGYNNHKLFLYLDKLLFVDNEDNFEPKTNFIKVEDWFDLNNIVIVRICRVSTV